MTLADRLSGHLDDLNLHMLYKDGVITYDDFKRLLAERAMEKLTKALESSGVPNETQQLAISRLLAGKGGDR